MITQKPFFTFLFLSLILGSMISCSSPRKAVSTTMHSDINPLRFEIVEQAKSTVGSGYKYGATGKQKFDCSGLIYSLFQSHSISLPRSTTEMARYGEPIKLQEVQPGDLIFFRNVRKIDHVAIVSRKTQSGTWLIHSTTSRGVVEEILEKSPYWRSRIDQCRRFIP